MQAYLQGLVVMTLFGLLDPQGVNLLQGFNRDLIMIDTWPAISSAGQLKAASSLFSAVLTYHCNVHFLLFAPSGEGP